MLNILKNVKENRAAVLAIFFAVLVFFIGQWSVEFLGIQNPNTAAILSCAIVWSFLILIYFYTKWVEKARFLGFSEEKKSAKFYILSAILVPIGIFLIWLITFEVFEFFNIEYGKWRGILPLWRIVLMAFTAGICEELIFRGFLLSRLHKIAKNDAVAVILSAVLFSLAHYQYKSWVMLLNPLWFGLFAGVFYLKYRNIKSLIIIHILINLTGNYIFQWKFL